MARRLIFDTGVLINVERARSALGSIIGAEDDLAIAAVTAAELHAGVELADEHHRTRRADFVARILEAIPVEPYGLSIAEAHGRLLAHVHRTGTRRGAHDLIVAATATVTRRTILTTDRSASFDALPGVECVVL